MQNIIKKESSNYSSDSGNIYQNNRICRLGNPLEVVPFLQSTCIMEGMMYILMYDKNRELYGIICIKKEVESKIIEECENIAKRIGVKHVIICVSIGEEGMYDGKEVELCGKLVDKMEESNISMHDYIEFSRESFYSYRYNDMLVL
jgi:hypothetical protein